MTDQKDAFEGAISKDNIKQFCYGSDDMRDVKFMDMLFSNDSYERKHAIGRIVDFFVRKTKMDYRNHHGFYNPIFSYQAILSDGARVVLDKLQELVKNEVISLTSVQRLEFKGQKIITELFDAFTTDPTRLLPREDAKRWKDASGDTRSQHRVICDYIAGMTDEYATKRYQQLFVPREGSVFDRF